MAAKIGRAGRDRVEVGLHRDVHHHVGEGLHAVAIGRGVGPGGEADGRSVEEAAGECVGVGAERVTQHRVAHEHEVAEGVGREGGNG